VESRDIWHITGGAGFVGSHFVRRALARSDAQLVIVDTLTGNGSLANLADLIDHPRVRFVEADIADAHEIDAVVRAYPPAAIVNLAAETCGDRAADPATFVRTNVIGTLVLLEAARAHYDGLRGGDRERFRFLQVSTGDVYGTADDAGEDAQYAPTNPYSASKAGADHLVRAYHHTYGLPALVTHSSHNYGPCQPADKLIPRTILRAVAGRAVAIPGDGSAVRDWLHVEDHCDALLQVLDYGRPGEHYNISGSWDRTMLEVVDAVCGILEGLRPAAGNPALGDMAAYTDLKVFVRDRPGRAGRRTIDAGKIVRTLGWQPAHGFELGLEETVRWYLAQDAWRDAAGASGDAHSRVGLGYAGRTAIADRR